MGFAVAEINDLLSLWRDRSRQSADVKKIAQSHIDELSARITALEQMRGTLQTLVTGCVGDARPDCPIIADLEEPAEDRGSVYKPDGVARLRHQSITKRRVT